MNEPKRREPVMKSPTRPVIQARLSYCHLDAPYAGTPGNEPKYSVTCIVPKSDTKTVEALRAAFKAAYNEGVLKKWEGARPNPESTAFKDPIKDGDKPADLSKPKPELAGCYYFQASSRTAVPVMNRMKEDITPTDAYSGCWALVSLAFFPYKMGSTGISVGLNAVMKVADDDRLDGRGDARSDFDGFGDLDETDSFYDL